MTDAQPVSPAASRLALHARRSRSGAPQTQDARFRRSRFIAVMKVLLPSAAITLLILIALWPERDLRDGRFRLDFSQIVDPTTAEPQMLNPRLLSIDARKQQLTLTANMATQISGVGESAIFELSEPKADIMLEDGTWWALTASEGLFQRESNVVDLNGAVSLFHDSGYEFGTETVRVFLDRRDIVGAQAIKGHGPFGEIQAEGFRILDGGLRMLFTGKSKLTIFGDLKQLAK